MLGRYLAGDIPKHKLGEAEDCTKTWMDNPNTNDQ